MPIIKAITKKGKNMKKVIRLLAFSLTAVIFSSCLTSGVDITVKKDGSGELVQTFQVLKEFMAFMNLGEAGTDPNMINMDQLRNQAEIMGEGVTFVRVEPAPADSPYAGYKAYYAFSDITEIRTSPTPMTTPGESISDSDWISFDFRKGSTAKLTILSPSDDDDDFSGSDDDEWESEPSSQEEQAQIEQMKQIYSSMHFWFKVKVDGRITDTDALYADESEIIIMDMPFEKIIENDQLFKKITSDQADDLDRLRKDLEKAGVKIDDREKIEISFR